MKAKFTLTLVLEILLLEARSVLRLAQRITGSERVKERLRSAVIVKFYREFLFEFNLEFVLIL